MNNILRSIFSCKFIIVFALFALFLAPTSNTHTSRAQGFTKCPCTYLSAYRAAKKQARRLDIPLAFEVCEDIEDQENDILDILELRGPAEPNSCEAAIRVASGEACDDADNCCSYNFTCEVEQEPELFEHNVSTEITAEEAEACERIIRRVAHYKGIPCLVTQLGEPGFAFTVGPGATCASLAAIIGQRCGGSNSIQFIASDKWGECTKYA